jgi:hypothetical protein
MLSRFGQLDTALPPIVVIFFPKLILLIAVLVKASSPISFTLSPNVTFSRLEQSINARSPTVSALI